MNPESTAEILKEFAIYGELTELEPFGNGHINDTYRSSWNQAGTRVRYIHQRINHKVFTRPDEVMDNILRVTTHIREKHLASGDPDRSRRSLTVVSSRGGKPWVRDRAGNWWRSYLFIENSHSGETASSPEEAEFLGASVGRFQKQLADMAPPRLFDTIPDFHNMEKRYLLFYKAAEKDAYSRVKDAFPEIKFLRENERRGAVLTRALREGRIPERISHNDTKMNNILIDDKDAKALCVIDLDTVMPGTSLFDAGDLVRTVCNAAEEDERDLSKAVFNTALFEALLKGYLSEAGEFLTSGELNLLAESGRSITQIMALRFLTDYLEGDHYYRTKRPGHNLDRCRNQIALIRSMDSKWEDVLNIVEKLTSPARRGV